MLQQTSETPDEGELGNLGGGDDEGVMLPLADIARVVDPPPAQQQPTRSGSAAAAAPPQQPPAPPTSPQPSAPPPTAASPGRIQDVGALTEADLDRLSAAAAAMRVRPTYQQPAGPAPPPPQPQGIPAGSAAAALTDTELFYTKFMFEAQQMRLEAENAELGLSPVDAQARSWHRC